MEIDLNDLAEKLGAEIANPPQGVLAIAGLAALRDAGENDLSFFHDDRYLSELQSTRAVAVLVARDFDQDVTHVPLLKVESPSLALDLVAKELFAAGGAPAARFGVHPSAVVAGDAKLDPARVAISANAVVGEGCEIGDGTVIGAGVVIGYRVAIGSDCKIHPNVTLYDRGQIGDRVIVHAGCVLGADGFGFEFDAGAHQKIEHFGFVEIGDDVEIGANTTIDRGRFGRTSIGAGTKIDNLVQIGHNVTLGEHCIIVADTAIAGSSRIGDHVTMAAQVGLAGHIEVGPFSVLIARSGVTKSLPGGTPDKPAFYSGFPAGPAAKVRKEMVAPRKVPDILRRLKALEKKFDDA